ncbi:hypothetical protein ACO0LM_23195 [Undibacterium sp. Di26W]|uniref:hypothetical protein n=1 Tax=Undibacterium sp. Di26W TaxID=3413035 RepID=UPI003BEFC900
MRSINLTNWQSVRSKSYHLQNKKMEGIVLINYVENLFASLKKYSSCASIKRSLIFLALAMSAQNCFAVTCMEKWLPMFLKEKYSPEDIDKLLAVACKTPVTLVAKSNVVAQPDKAAAAGEPKAATETPQKPPVPPVASATPAPASAAATDPAEKGNADKALDKALVAFPSPASDNDDYLGDRIKYGYSRSAYKVDMLSDKKTLTLVCVPQYFTLKGIGKLSVKLDPAKDSKLENAFVVTGVESKKIDSKLCEGTTTIALGEVVVFSQNETASTPPDRYGLTYGTLMVPYKYHVGSKNFSGGTSVGGYLGYRQEKSGLGLGLQWVGFVGAGQIPVTQSVNGQDKTQNLTGFSYGLGILGTVKDKFHMGFILGADRVNTDAGYKDNGKPWIAIEVGYAFSN